MPKSERTIQSEIWEGIPRSTTLFRNNVGAWRTEDGRLIKYGLFKGSSDLIGWTEVTVTPEMVGDKVAVFTAIECKKSTGRKRKEQVHFVSVVELAGGLAGFARSVGEALRIVRG